MSLTIDLPHELESQLLKSAAAAGVTPQDYAHSVIVAELRRTRMPKAPVPHLSAEESRLMIAINDGLPHATWQRHRELREKVQKELITDGEREELRLLTKTIELAHAQRLERLCELAILRKIKLDDLMQQLGIPNQVFGRTS